MSRYNLLDYTQDEILMLLSRIDYQIALKNISYSDFYAGAGITASAVSKWRKGITKPRKSVIENIAKFLDIPVEYLLQDAKKTAIPEDSGLSADEAELIQLIQALSPEEQDRELAYLRELSQRHEGEKER